MADQDAEIITPPNSLKTKVREGGPNAIDEATLRRAEQAIQNMKSSYIDWVSNDLRRIEGSYKMLVEGQGDRKRNLDDIFSVAHDIKGQGSTFGYDLATSIGNHLCRIIERFGESGADDLENEAVRIHIEAIKLVIAQDLAGDGGEAGEAIMAGIKKLDSRFE